MSNLQLLWLDQRTSTVPHQSSSIIQLISPKLTPILEMTKILWGKAASEEASNQHLRNIVTSRFYSTSQALMTLRRKMYTKLWANQTDKATETESQVLWVPIISYRMMIGTVKQSRSTLITISANLISPKTSKMRTLESTSTSTSPSPSLWATQASYRAALLDGLKQAMEEADKPGAARPTRCSWVALQGEKKSNQA